MISNIETSNRNLNQPEHRTVDALQALKDNKSLIIDEVIYWQKLYHPTRTNDYNKCFRDLNYVFDAYIDDLTMGGSRNIQYVASKYWFNDQRQIKEYETEIAVHNYMIEYILTHFIADGHDKIHADQRNMIRNRLMYLRSVLIDIIKSGPEYMNYTHMHKFRYVMEYDTENLPDDFLIKQSLYEAWASTPSKQQFMPYNIFVLGPDDKKAKELLYRKSMMREYDVNFNRYDVDVSNWQEFEKAWIDHRSPGQYINYKTAPYVLICTQRVENNMNPWNKRLAGLGWNFEQTTSEWQKDPKRKNRALGLALIEIGMFIQTFSNLCLKHNIDISHTRCTPTTMDFWSEPEFSFLENPPQLIISAGFGKTYRRDFFPRLTHGADHRPDFERIVKFINGT
jgi:hypothetical protein